jgi:hypothetical protein
MSDLKKTKEFPEGAFNISKKFISKEKCLDFLNEYFSNFDEDLLSDEVDFDADHHLGSSAPRWKVKMDQSCVEIWLYEIESVGGSVFKRLAVGSTREEWKLVETLYYHYDYHQEKAKASVVNNPDSFMDIIIKTNPIIEGSVYWSSDNDNANIKKIEFLITDKHYNNYTEHNRANLEDGRPSEMVKMTIELDGELFGLEDSYNLAKLILAKNAFELKNRS